MDNVKKLIVALKSWDDWREDWTNEDMLYELEYILETIQYLSGSVNDDICSEITNIETAMLDPKCVLHGC